MNIVSLYVGVFASSFFILVPGVIWLSVYTGRSLVTAVSAGIIPFLVGDLVKCGMATIASYTVRSGR